MRANPHGIRVGAHITMPFLMTDSGLAVSERRDHGGYGAKGPLLCGCVWSSGERHARVPCKESRQGAKTLHPEALTSNPEGSSCLQLTALRRVHEPIKGYVENQTAFILGRLSCI